MKTKKYSVAGIGSPLVDFTLEVNDSVLKELGLKKGQMHLVDEAASKSIFTRLAESRFEKTPGGSTGNTLAGIANLGGSGVMLGTVGNDDEGDFYINETEKTGIKSALVKHNSMTGNAITFITPDSERTFATHLGAALQFRKSDVNRDIITESGILHIEGYLLELPEIREAAVYAMDIAKDAGISVSVDLADPGLIGRIPDVINEIVEYYADIVFVNEEEAKAFTGKSGSAALDILHDFCSIAVVKLGDKGSLVKHKGKTYNIPVYKTTVVNTNGAGDMYAAGFLYGISSGITVERAANIASYVSSLVVAQVGARLKGKADISTIR